MIDLGFERPLGPDVPVSEQWPPHLLVDYLSATVDGRDVLWQSVPVVIGEPVEITVTFRTEPNPAEPVAFSTSCDEGTITLTALPLDDGDPPAIAAEGSIRTPPAQGAFTKDRAGNLVGTATLETDRLKSDQPLRVQMAMGSCGVSDWTPILDLTPVAE